MNDKERLQRIKEDVSFWEYCLKNTHWCELVSHDIEKIKWLIERAERYEKALREIANEQEVGEGDFNAADVANNLIATAKEALGDES